MAIGVKEARRRINAYDKELKVVIETTQSFKEDLTFDIEDCVVIKQELLEDTIVLTVAYFDN